VGRNRDQVRKKGTVRGNGKLSEGMKKEREGELKEKK
jgi:hypothetical protein